MRKLQDPGRGRLRSACAAAITAVVVSAVALATAAPMGAAMALEPPVGPAILTVAGAITHHNRGAFDSTEDLLFAYHDYSFDHAARFDLAMLEALPSQDVSVSYAGWPRPAQLSGPWLRDVLAAAGATPKEGLTAVALDGFASEISPDDLAAQDWLVALKRDGRPLDLGGRGPVWLAYARRDGKVADAEDEGRWPWAVFLIEVK